MSGQQDESSLRESEPETSRYSLGSNLIHDSSGVDRSLIRSNLRRTPTECLQSLEELLQLTESARGVDESVR